MPRLARAPADRVIRTTLREVVHFPDLTERLALRLAAVPRYTARSHFGPWLKIMTRPDFAGMTGIFMPLAYIELETSDLPTTPNAAVRVRGESYLARTLRPDGEVRHLVRDGRHAVHGAGGAPIASARLVNVFTRYDPDPARRRVVELPAELGGSVPSRITEVPGLDDLVPRGRRPDFEGGAGTHVWHYGQTDPNRHVNGVAYLRVLEAWTADVLADAGQDVGRVFAQRARVAYRKPCFRGERYRCVGWVVGESPLTVVAAVRKADDPPETPPAVAAELRFGVHDAS